MSQEPTFPKRRLLRAEGSGRRGIWLKATVGSVADKPALAGVLTSEASKAECADKAPQAPC